MYEEFKETVSQLIQADEELSDDEKRYMMKIFDQLQPDSVETMLANCPCSSADAYRERSHEDKFRVINEDTFIRLIASTVWDGENVPNTVSETFLAKCTDVFVEATARCGKFKK